MQLDQTLDNSTSDDTQTFSDDDLHAQANEYIAKSNQLIFQELPTLIAKLIQQEVWKKRNIDYKNFGEYALNQSPDGLGIANNDMLWLLRSAMNIKTQHANHWGDVLGEVENEARTYAKKNKIAIKDLNKNLTEHDNTNPELEVKDAITYLPSRSKSLDGQLLKLKHKDPEAYETVVQGKKTLKEVFVQAPKKRLEPIESVKNKFASLSKPDREAFLAWIEQEKESLLQ